MLVLVLGRLLHFLVMAAWSGCIWCAALCTLIESLELSRAGTQARSRAFYQQFPQCKEVRCQAEACHPHIHTLMLPPLLHPTCRAAR